MQKIKNENRRVKKSENENPRIKKSENENLIMKKSENRKSETNYNLVTTQITY